MIRWCAYCQTYQGEVAPFADYRVTHGICPRCARRHRSGRVPDLTKIRKIADYHARFFGREGRYLHAPGRLLDEGLALGLRPVDLLMGIIQPVLYEMGRRWSLAEASIAEEHRLSALCASLIELLRERYPEQERLRQSKRPVVLLVNADGNAHDLGLRIVEFVLVDGGIPVFAAYPGLPADEVMDLVASLRPRTLAVSAALEAHLEPVGELAGRVRALPKARRPALVVGGLAVRVVPDAVPAGAAACPHARILAARLARGLARRRRRTP